MDLTVRSVKPLTGEIPASPPAEQHCGIFLLFHNTCFNHVPEFEFAAPALFFSICTM